jgi:hypothetical protein
MSNISSASLAPVRPGHLVNITTLADESIFLNERGIPALMRVSSVLDSVLVDIDAKLDEAGCIRAAAILNSELFLVGEYVTAAMNEEMGRMVGPLIPNPTPGLLRIAYVQLSGWLSGLVASEQTREMAATYNSAFGESQPSSPEITTLSNSEDHTLGYL